MQQHLSFLYITQLFYAAPLFSSHYPRTISAYNYILLSSCGINDQKQHAQETCSVRMAFQLLVTLFRHHEHTLKPRDLGRLINLCEQYVTAYNERVVCYYQLLISSLSRKHNFSRRESVSYELPKRYGYYLVLTGTQFALPWNVWQNKPDDPIYS